jgi:hypothetical protein
VHRHTVTRALATIVSDARRPVDTVPNRGPVTGVHTDRALSTRAEWCERASEAQRRFSTVRSRHYGGGAPAPEWYGHRELEVLGPLPQRAKYLELEARRVTAKAHSRLQFASRPSPRCAGRLLPPLRRRAHIIVLSMTKTTTGIHSGEQLV